MEITYSKYGDYLFPDLLVPGEKSLHIGRYGFLRLRYLKQQRRVLYISLKTTCGLNEHLADIDRQALEMVDLLTAQIAKAEGVTKDMKGRDQMAWVGAMNNIRNRAEEIVLKEIVYS